MGALWVVWVFPRHVFMELFLRGLFGLPVVCEGGRMPRTVAVIGSTAYILWGILIHFFICALLGMGTVLERCCDAISQW